MFRSRFIPGCYTCALVALVGCGCAHDRGIDIAAFSPATGAPTRNLTAHVVADYRPGVDYFPDKVSFRHAKQFHVEYHDNYKTVRIVTNDVREEMEYIFVQRGTPVPPNLPPDAHVIAVPVARFSLGTYRYGLAADLLGVTDRLVGVALHMHVTTPSIQRMFDDGRLQKNFDLEAIANRGCEIQFNYYSVSSLDSTDETFSRMGTTIVPMAEHLESTPLARSEWIKFFAMFFNAEALPVESSMTPSANTARFWRGRNE